MLLGEADWGRTPGHMSAASATRLRDAGAVAQTSSLVIKPQG